jgi:hypothetical protein
VEELHEAKCGSRFGVHGCDWVQRRSKELDFCGLGSLTAAVVEGHFVYSIAIDNNKVVIR